METFTNLHLLVASMWFYQEWKESEDVTSSFIKGFFWEYEVFEKIIK